MNTQRLETLADDYLRASFLMDISVAKAIESFWSGQVSLGWRWVGLAVLMVVLYVFEVRRRVEKTVEETVDDVSE